MTERLSEIERLPAEIRDHCLVDWKTVATILGAKDIEHARNVITEAGVPRVHVSERRKLPRWGALRQFITSRER